MSFPQAIRRVLSKYADFGGRAMRSEYWWWVLAVMVGNVIFGTVDYVLPFRFLQPIFALSVLVPTWAVVTRRLHDTGRSGGWAALSLVSGAIFAFSILVFIFGALLAGFGDPGEGETVFALGIIGITVSALILLVIAIWSIIWLVQRGEDGPNQFGEVPRLGVLSNPSRHSGF